jgi:eukaryotic-like serine/threonine-protein kinase
MSGASPPSMHPASLPPGTLVGRWRVVDWAGRGTHGAVYRAVPADKEYDAPVALKLALLPRNPRLVREAELLSRLRNPSIPRLWDDGEWQHPGGDFFPYLAMEWIDGVPLYAWARQEPFSAPRTFQMLAQLARALQSIHAQGCVHRDVKGDNVLVRRSDGRAMLIDFGSGLSPDAPTLTPPDAYPGTPAYRSPESGLFELQSLRDRSARYRAGPADELYALGVTACRWLTGEYPRFGEPSQDEHGIWRMDAVKLPDALLQVEPPLRAVVLSLLSVRPEERGTPAQLAEELERAARPSPIVAVRSAEPPPPAPSPEAKTFTPEELPGEQHRANGSHLRRPARRRWPWLATVASGLMLAGWVGWGWVGKLAAKSSVLSATTTGAGRADAGTAGLGEAVSAASTVDAPEPSIQAMAEEPLPEPMPGQTRPDAKGRCPHKRQVVLNGACWIPFDPEACEASVASGQVFRGKCYVPALPRNHPSTSGPSRTP